MNVLVRDTNTTKSAVFDLNQTDMVPNSPKMYNSPSRKFYNKKTQIVDIPGPERAHLRLANRPVDNVVL